ncbi:Maf family protein [Alicyclobacillus dauci]|uniref:dTTP/UTP pyrophosphatase n=1 Tax=Alicyclobacillus dauci TaxID=1475485 RepID=A0ABY6YZP7_9BACL|nr:Maf family protein [Alicyclobacillus dauci]WAH35932.1 Maf family protein [Alicyclobacillus dauci]
MMKHRLILASGSPRRRQLLEMLGLSFDIIVTNADESFEPSLPPANIVRELAHRKASAAVRSITGSDERFVVVAADTVVVVDGDILGKPSTEDEAIDMLTRLQGRHHDVYTGVAVYDSTTDKTIGASVQTRVWMHPRAKEWLTWYVRTGEPMDKAGSYAIQGQGSLLVERIEGDFYNVVGLPVGKLDEIFTELGLSIQSWMEA